MRPGSLPALGTGLAVAAVAAVAVPAVLPVYYVFLCTSAVVAGVALQSLGVVSGRAGMLSLCQASFAAIGAWTVAWLSVNGAPGSLLLWLVAGGLAAVPFGVAIGLPALRLRGINLAVATLAFAASADVILVATSFPGQTELRFVQRPPGFESDQRYFVLCVMVFALVGVGLSLAGRTRLGASWAAVAHSERAAASHGVSVPRSKLAAFALSAFIAGVSGGLLAGQLGTLVASNFDVLQSLVLFALATMAGARNAEGAVFGGLLVAFFPEVLRRTNLPQDLGNIAFAVGATQALSMGSSQSEALRAALRRRLARRRAATAAPRATATRPAAPARPAGPAGDGVPALEARDLSVRFGSVVALDRVSLRVPEATVVALVGPNGAGKSTLIDAVSGLLAGYEGGVRLSGQALEGTSAHRRARQGLRRTFQHARIPPDLTAGQYVRLAAGRRLGAGEVDEVLAWLGCPGADAPVATVDVGSRRLLEVAGAVAARPRVVLLDEPAAGQSYEESMRLAERIAELPARYGSAVVLVEHDIDLVRVCASSVTVLDFGQVIASGPPERALADEAVVKAYLGVADDLAVS